MPNVSFAACKSISLGFSYFLFLFVPPLGRVWPDVIGFNLVLLPDFVGLEKSISSEILVCELGIELNVSMWRHGVQRG